LRRDVKIDAANEDGGRCEDGATALPDDCGEMTLKMAVVALSPQQILMIGRKPAIVWCNFWLFLQTSLSAQSTATTGNMAGASTPTRRAKYKRMEWSIWCPLDPLKFSWLTAPLAWKFSITLQPAMRGNLFRKMRGVYGPLVLAL
ncbi:hypothetical protein EJB05_05177, partial [Eragrostis curvula]